MDEPGTRKASCAVAAGIVLLLGVLLLVLPRVPALQPALAFLQFSNSPLRWAGPACIGAGGLVFVIATAALVIDLRRKR